MLYKNPNVVLKYVDTENQEMRGEEDVNTSVPPKDAEVRSLIVPPSLA